MNGVVLRQDSTGKPARATLDNAKIEALIPATRQQIVRGGVRLARLLDEALR